jgi:glycosyltransferase involved in cell wall biosynthesis
VDVTIFTTHLDYPRGVLDVRINRPTKRDGVTIHYFPVQFKPLVVSIQMAAILWRETRNFNVIHIHGIYRFPQSFAAWCARRHGVPYIIQPHGSLDPYLYHQKRHQWLKRIYEHLVDMPNLRCASAIHYTTAEERELTRFLNIADRGVVIPNGLELSRFEKLPNVGEFRERWGIPGNVPLILFLGRINFKKGLDLLIPAFARTYKEWPRAHLVIAGPDNEGYGQKVRGWIRKHGIKSRVTFTGMLKREETVSAYVDADLFVLPSYTENFGMTVVEAMACGCPVVISDRVNIWREVNQASAGLVTQCDVEYVAKAMLKLLGDDELRKSMGRAGRALVREKYDWKQISLELIRLYENLVGS